MIEAKVDIERQNKRRDEVKDAAIGWNTACTAFIDVVIDWQLCLDIPDLPKEEIDQKSKQYELAMTQWESARHRLIFALPEPFTSKVGDSYSELLNFFTGEDKASRQSSLKLHHEVNSLLNSEIHKHLRRLSDEQGELEQAVEEAQNISI